MGQGRRPTAWDVSFPGEDFGEGSSSREVDDRDNTYSSRSPSVVSTSTTKSLGKRKQYDGVEPEVRINYGIFIGRKFSRSCLLTF